MSKEKQFRSILKISKPDAAKRQLETAIRLWFHDGEPASIYTLTASAHQILHDLGKARGVTTAFRGLQDIRPEFRKRFLESFLRIENFLKHADRDPEITLEFDPSSTPFILMDAVASYEELTGERPHIMRTFNMWMLANNPDAVKPELRADWDEKMRQAAPFIKGISKQEFFTTYLAALARSEAVG